MTQLPLKRLLLLAIWAIALVTISAWAVVSSVSMVDRPFPGFFVQPMVYVAPYQAEPLPDHGLRARDELVALEGRVIESSRDLYTRAAAVPIGTPLHYTVMRGERRGEAVLPTERFTWEDWGRSFGSLFALSWGFSLIGLVLLWLRPGHRPARALAIATGALGLLLLLYFDFNTGGAAGRLFLPTYAMIGAAFLDLALSFPKPLPLVDRFRWLLALPWGVALGLALIFECGYLAGGAAVSDPSRYHFMYVLLAIANLWAMQAPLVLIIAIAGHAFFEPRGSLERHQAGAALAGAVLGMAPFVVWAIALFVPALPHLPLSAALYCLAFFPLAIAYAIVRARLFDISLVIRNSVLYGALSALLAGVYVLAATAFRWIGLGGWSDGLAGELLSTALVVALFAPLRDRLQALIDRRLFREKYDAQAALEEASQSMTALLDLDEIIDRMLATIESTLHTEAGAVLLHAEDAGAYLPYARRGETHFPALAVDSALVREIVETEEILSRVTLPVQKRHRVSGNLEALTAELVVPLSFEGRLLGLLVLGAKRSETHFTDQDLKLLKTLGNQSAIALSNALAYRRIRHFNQELESKVRERTAELERAYVDLRDAQAMVVHTERMAALGQLVAGVAHELNNPLGFVYSGVGLLKSSGNDLLELLAAYRRGDPADTLAALERDLHGEELAEELRMLTDSCLQGAKRMKAIVDNLRKFSRLDEFDVGAVDVRDGLETTLSLIRANYRHRVRFHESFAEVPLIAGSPSHLNQVFMNILVNACQAIDGPGDVWISLQHEEAGVVVAIRDSGPGIPEEARARIFEPFFTTKPVGEGTGLGLSICHGIVDKHGGRIEVDGAPEGGTIFRLVFPIPAPEESTAYAEDHSGR